MITATSIKRDRPRDWSQNVSPTIGIRGEEVLEITPEALHRLLAHDLVFWCRSCQLWHLTDITDGEVIHLDRVVLPFLRALLEVRA